MLSKPNNVFESFDRQLPLNNYVDFFILKWTAHSIEQTPFTRVLPSGINSTAESIEEMRIKCLAQGHNILTQTDV